MSTAHDNNVFEIYCANHRDYSMCPSSRMHLIANDTSAFVPFQYYALAFSVCLLHYTFTYLIFGVCNRLY